MLPLYRDPHYLFRFADSRIIARIRLEGATAGQRVKLVRVDASTLKQSDVIAEANIGADGWVELAEPLIVHAGEAFVAAPSQLE
ncbi:MAG: hypothetical protein K2X38_21955 [Gemmataceae bacterium]|nr:hypothetical protein [Gemmataceae bacterium]